MASTNTKLVVETEADTSGICKFLAVNLEVVPRGYLAVPVKTAIHTIVTDLFCSCEALRKDTDLNYCVFQLVLRTLETPLTRVTRSILVREVAIKKLETIDESLDMRSFVEYEPHGYWANKAAALYMQARPTYGLSSMPINDEFEHLVLMDVFLTAYVMGRQEARRDWYNKNPDGYRRDVMKNGNDAHIRAMQDDKTI